MCKTKEIFREIAAKNELYSVLDHTDEFSDAMQKYAESYAMECLRIAAENAKLEKVLDEFYGQDTGRKQVDRNSILNITLPKHL